MLAARQAMAVYAIPFGVAAVVMLLSLAVGVVTLGVGLLSA
jgi:hypothetical protein